MIIRTLLSAFAAIALLVMPAGPANAGTDPDRAEEFINNLGEEVLEVLQRGELSESEAREEFGRIFRTGFDIPTIGQFVLARYWRQADSDQRREYIDLFEQMVIETYARRFREYSDEQFEITRTRPEGDRDVLVTTRVYRPGGGDSVEVAWRVRDRDDGPQIIDVIIEGVSMGVTQRQEFASVIERNNGSIDALLDQMRDHVNSASR